jgi:hypothetical protein
MHESPSRARVPQGRARLLINTSTRRGAASTQCSRARATLRPTVRLGSMRLRGIHRAARRRLPFFVRNDFGGISRIVFHSCQNIGGRRPIRDPTAVETRTECARPSRQSARKYGTGYVRGDQIADWPHGRYQSRNEKAVTMMARLKHALVAFYRDNKTIWTYVLLVVAAVAMTILILVVIRLASGVTK